MPTLEVPGAEINYEISGSGEPLLMIRGVGSHLGWWNSDFKAALQDRFSLVLYDHRGTGGSVHKDGEYTIPLIADDAATLLQGLGIEKAHIFGISLGGMVAQEIVLRHPQVVKTLVLGCTHCGGERVVWPSPEVVQILLARAQEESGGKVGQAWLEAAFTSEFVQENPKVIAGYTEKAADRPTSPDIYRLQAMAAAAFDAWERLPSITAPTWIMHGERDAMIPPENAFVPENRIPFAHLILLPGMGHDFTVQNPFYSAWLLTGILCKSCFGDEGHDGQVVNIE